MDQGEIKTSNAHAHLLQMCQTLVDFERLGERAHSLTPDRVLEQTAAVRVRIQHMHKPSHTRSCNVWLTLSAWASSTALELSRLLNERLM